MDWSQVTNHLVFLALTWLVFAITAIGLGVRLIAFLKRSRELNTLEQIATLFVGYSLLSFTMYFLAALHLLYPSVVIGIGLIALLGGFLPGVATIRTLARTGWQTLTMLLSPHRVGWLTSLAAVAVGVTVIFILLQGMKGALLPDRSFDAIWYHLTEAKLYLQEHRLLFWLPPSQFAQSPVAPRLMEFLDVFTLPFSPLGDWARWAHGSLLLVALAAAYHAGQRLSGRPLGAVLALLTTALLPINIWLTTTSYVDLATLAGSALLIAVLVDAFGGQRFPATGVISSETRDLARPRPSGQWPVASGQRSSSDRVVNDIKSDLKPPLETGSWKLETRHFWLLALIGGLLLAAKLWNLMLLPSLLIFFLVLPADRRPTWRTILGLLGLMLLIDSPYPIEALIRTGNPIYPILQPGFADPDHLRGALTIKEYLVDVLPQTTLATWAHLLVYESLLWIGGALALMRLLAGMLNRTGLAFMAFATALLVLWSFIPVADMRYALMAVPALAVVGATAIAATLEIPSLLALIIVLTLASGSINLAQAIRQEESQYDGPRPVTLAERIAYIEQTLGTDRWIVVDPRHEIQTIVGQKRILVLGHNLFYLNVPFTDAYGIALQGVFAKPGTGPSAPTSEALLQQLRDHGYQYLLVKQSVYSMKDVFAGLNQPTVDWINQHFRQIWSDSATNETLYELIP